MNRRVFFLIITLLITISLLAACGGSAATTTATTKVGTTSAGSTATQSKNDSWSIAVSCPLTGDNALYGTYYKNGVQMFVDRVNAAGGVGGKKFSIDWYDDKATPKEATSIAQLIVDTKKYIAVIGNWDSSCTLATASIYASGNMVQMVPNAGHKDLASASKYVWRHQNTTITEYGDIANRVVNQLGYKKVALFYTNNDAGIDAKNTLTTMVNQYGGKIVADQGFIQGEVRDFSTIITNIKNSGAEVVVTVAQYADVGALMLQMEQFGLDVPFFCNGSAYTDDFIALAGKSAEGTYSTTIFFADDPKESIVKFTKEYKEKFSKNPNYFATNTYESLKIIQYCIEKGATDRASLFQQMNNIKEWNGDTCSLKWDDNRNITKATTVVQIVNGKWVYSSLNKK